MRLEISNFAKIDYADLKIDGITVIAGENNTGKTTVGKLLYCVFNSLFDIESKIDRQIDREIWNVCRRYLRNSMVMGTAVSSLYKNETIFTSRVYDETCMFIVKKVCNEYPKEFSVSRLADIVKNAFEEHNLEVDKQLDNVIEELYDKLCNVVKTDRRKIELETVFQFFDLNFASQMQSLKSDAEAEIKLTIKDHPISISIMNGTIGMEGNINIMHEAYLLDDPFVIDDLRSQFLDLNKSDNAIRPRDFLTKKMRKYEESIDNIFDTVYAKEKISEIMRIVNDIIPGKIASKGGKWTLSSDYLDNPVDFYNLSAGLKSFVVLKMLIEKGILKEKDVLILDEPEIHLHPDWQLKYAEIIVLLQKMFDLNIVVTTHSRDFLEAINLLSKKYNIADRCNYYFAKQENGGSTFEDVTNDITVLYRQMIQPMMLLDALRFELEEDDDE